MEWCETHSSGFNWHNHEEQFGPRCDAYRDLLAVEATHTNYNTGEPCYCDIRFGHRPGPCINEEPVVTGDDPRNGTG